MYAPIVVFVYNRADHFEKVYEALKKCPESKKSDLIVFSDGAKNEKTEESVLQVRAFISSVRDDGAFKSFSVFESNENKGLAKSIISGVTEVINKYGRVIVLEDDCVPSEHFLGYMNGALDYYESDNSIGSIAGYAENILLPSDYTSDIYLTRRSCSWGWATWSNRWENVDWKLENLRLCLKDYRFLKQFNSNGNDRLVRLYRQSKGQAGSWSVCFGAHHVINGYLVVYPRYSYIYNIGDDGTGVHTKVGEISDQLDLAMAISNPDLAKPQFDHRIQKIIKRVYSAGVLSDIKRGLFTLMLFLKANLTMGR